jgi:hypothetical protein
MLLVGSIFSRQSFGDLLIRMHLLGYAVEVGTHRGAFARMLLDVWPGDLVCVDPWDVPPGYEYQAAMLDGGGTDRDEDFDLAKQALDRHLGRYMFMRCLSAQAWDKFHDDSLDFVYIDGNHERPHIDEDLEQWWRKVAPGAILAGHDIICPGEKPEVNWGRHIQPAVLQFAEAQGVDVHLVLEPDGLPWSFYIIKPNKR